MAMYRVYVTLEDEYGLPAYARVGRTYGDIKKAIEAARRASERYGVAELKDDAMRLSERLLSVFRKGHQVAG